ncbi:amino acid ABC transporter membrane protein 2 (PAAT family) [Ciceribacter lividus]|uniref:Amino acid ABC transporter membrane protein 2 (PAAT family) n=1 Tax=Ciceribacter lividus TaxID=1197950 RepID=A0A6I7HSV1_9HYPH|nr:ABC transporter permease [Ciceribacter lividus]RCW28480.1 amino acid ABC transporter membrane protein 2 (PAAT family) [Ciceribacter lividus]
MSYTTELIAPRPAPVVPPKPPTAGRMIGYAGLALWTLLALSLIYMMVSNWDTDKFVKYGPRYLSGLWVTATLVFASILFGALLSMPIAFARMSKNRVLNAISYAYVYVFRGTPLLAQIYLIYYGLGSFRPQIEAVGLWWFFREAWYCALLSMTMNTAAYQAEILRGAIQSVPNGQIEGAKSLGLSPFVTFWKVILPQALIVALRPYGNEIVLMIKGSAVVAVVTVLDLMGQTRYTFSRTFDYQAYLWAAVFYLSIVETMRHVWAALEARLTRHLKR